MERISISPVNPPDDNGKIKWKKDYFLKIEDFQGESKDPDGNEAELVFSLIPKYTLEITHHKKMTTYSIKNLIVTACFNSKEAWINENFWPSDDKDTALKFYQGAFDITEEYARKSQNKAENEIYGKNFFCQGRTEEEQTNFLSKDAQRKITLSIKKEIAEMYVESQKYFNKVGTSEKFKENFKNYKKRFKDLRQEIDS